MWEAFGTVDNPEVMVNAEAAFNGIKMRAWRGMDPISDSTWADNNWHDTSEAEGMQHAQEAISAIRTVISVFEYLNHDTIMNNRDQVFSDMTRVLREFDDAVARVRQTATEAAELHAQFLHFYIFPRIESVYTWVGRRLDVMRDEWAEALTRAQSQPGTSARVQDIGSVLDTLTVLKEEADERMTIITSGVGDPADPGSP
ncbi:hypothetical protein IMZ48_46480 [Candidatus Bathyarchaeota archaeon]|nr:hypothetical protein [Candidatus Bathyarchaeota archaeon]